jgi:hypothetical protein
MKEDHIYFKMKIQILAIIAAMVLSGSVVYYLSMEEPETQVDDSNVTWNTAAVTWYTSYASCCPKNPNYDPKADKTECRDYSACDYPGEFAFIDHKSFDWVKKNNIVAFYDDSDPNGKQVASRYGKKFIILRKNGKEFRAQIADTCGNKDCGNCCHKNSKGGFLIDLEYWTAKNNLGGTS